MLLLLTQPSGLYVQLIFGRCQTPSPSMTSVLWIQETTESRRGVDQPGAVGNRRQLRMWLTLHFLLPAG